jgi:hypothetical protein
MVHLTTFLVGCIDEYRVMSTPVWFNYTYICTVVQYLELCVFTDELCAQRY